MKNKKMPGERSFSIALDTARAHLHGFVKQPTALEQNTASTKQSKLRKFCKLSFVRLYCAGVQKSEHFGGAPLHKSKAKIYSKNISKSTYKHSSVADRFSTSLVGRGKKGVGCKFLLKSLSISRRTSLDLLQSNEFRHASSKEGSAYKNRVTSADKKHRGKVSAQTSVLLNNVFVPKQKTREQHNNKSSLLYHNVLLDSLVRQQKGYKLCKTLFCTKPRYTLNKAEHFSGSAPHSTSRIACLCQKAMENVKPIVETRKVRRGGSTYQVPFVLDKLRQDGMAIRWLIESSVGRKAQSKALNTHHAAKSNAFDVRQKKINLLSVALTDSLRNTGQAIDKRNKAHQLALHNRAYMHYRWW